MSAAGQEPGDSERARMSASADTRASGVFVPMLLVACAVLIWAVFQSAQLVSARHTLRVLSASQQSQIAQAQKLRAALNTLAADTQRLADAGNADAKLLVAELRKRGVTINPNAPEAAPPPP